MLRASLPSVSTTRGCDLSRVRHSAKQQSTGSSSNALTTKKLKPYESLQCLTFACAVYARKLARENIFLGKNSETMAFAQEYRFKACFQQLNMATTEITSVNVKFNSTKRASVFLNGRVQYISGDLDPTSTCNQVFVGSCPLSLSIVENSIYFVTVAFKSVLSKVAFTSYANETAELPTTTDQKPLESIKNGKKFLPTEPSPIGVPSAGLSPDEVALSLKAALKAHSVARFLNYIEEQNDRQPTAFTKPIALLYVHSNKPGDAPSEQNVIVTFDEKTSNSARVVLGHNTMQVDGDLSMSNVESVVDVDGQKVVVEAQGRHKEKAVFRINGKVHHFIALPDQIINYYINKKRVKASIIHCQDNASTGCDDATTSNTLSEVDVYRSADRIDATVLHGGIKAQDNLSIGILPV